MALVFRPVETEADLALLDHALRRLSVDLGDTHGAGLDALRVGLMGDVPAAYGLLMLDEGLLGAALYGPVFSTVRGAAGVYVSDLWVDQTVRGRGLGRAVLAEVARRAGGLWRAEWMTLAVYAHSTGPRRFYERLGFEAQNATTMRLAGAMMQRLKGENG